MKKQSVCSLPKINVETEVSVIANSVQKQHRKKLSRPLPPIKSHSIGMCKYFTISIYIYIYIYICNQHFNIFLIVEYAVVLD